jgi:hypothetical protein
MSRITPIFALGGTLLLGACVAAPPSGPGIAVMPGQNKDFTAFQQDDASCRQYAQGQIGITPGEAAQQSQVNSAVVGTVLGAGLGAAIGAAAGNPGVGAAIGAGAGALTGTAAGANAGAVSGAAMQQRYDVSYAQCMTAKGNNVPPVASAAYAPYPGYAYPPPYPYPYAYAYPGYYPAYAYYPSGYVGFGWGGRHWR